MIYRTPDADAPIDQGDILDDCPILWIAGFEPSDLNAVQTVVSPERVLVLTQTCDFANQKISMVSVALIQTAQSLVDLNVLKAADIRADRVFGWYFLPQNAECGLPEMVVNLHQLHTVRLDILLALCKQGRRRARVQPLYREHLAKHFADTYSRIGLPEPYDTE